jgi:PIN domain nuclease of toxin-antitoxin system
LVLIDTHILLWWLYEPTRLSQSLIMLLGDRKNRIHVSAVSLWEISIKYGLKKLAIPGLDIFKLIDELTKQGFIVLEINAEDAILSIRLCNTPHKDPFDRMLAWQAISRELPLVSMDESMSAFEPFGLRRYILKDSGFMTNEEVVAYNAMAMEDP